MSFLRPITKIAEYVWNYSVRSLTRRFAILERGKGYASSPSIQTRERRAISPNTKIIVNANQTSIVGIFSEEKIHSATKTTTIPSGWAVLYNGAELDGDDNSYVIVQIPPNSSRSRVFKYDLGQVFSNLYMIIRCQSENANVRIYVAVSSDDVNYTDVLSTNSTGATWYFISVSNVRYVALDFSNSDSSNTYRAYVHTLEAYIPTSEKTFTNLTPDLLTVIVNGYYQVLEIMEV
jgi:hypothetical protein